MNLLAHVRIALDVAGDRPRTVLGAVLPDLESLAGQRVDRRHPDLEAGVAVHRATDAAFHDDPRFRSGSISLCRRLQARGVGRGASRAVGHAGWELLLDGLLVDDREVTAAFAAACDELLLLTAATDGPTDRLEWLAERQRTAPIWSAYCDPAQIAERLHRQLAHRPRLALAAHDLGTVSEELGTTRAQVLAEGPQLLRDISAATSAGPARSAPSR